MKAAAIASLVRAGSSHFLQSTKCRTANTFPVSQGQEVIILSCNKRNLLGHKEKIFMVSVVKQVPRIKVECQALETFKTQWDKALSNLL